MLGTLVVEPVALTKRVKTLELLCASLQTQVDNLQAQLIGFNRLEQLAYFYAWGAKDSKPEEFIDLDPYDFAKLYAKVKIDKPNTQMSELWANYAEQ